MTSVAVIFLVTGCLGPDGPLNEETVRLEGETAIELYFPTRTSNRGDDDALLEGTLLLNGACLQVSSAPTNTMHTVVWPKGTRVTLRNEQITVLKPNGDVFARVGAQLGIGGGEWGGPALTRCGEHPWSGEN